ncbi:MAG: baseplate J/gp47 family protein [Desulfobacterales bacterium]|nr:baseplate J/gp47 family protein [Desulfobacterales bacterium]
MTIYQKDFDALLDGILRDYRNQFPEADTSQGSLIFIRSACLASAVWGLYKYQDYLAQQIFPDTADTQNLEHHAWVRNLPRRSGETDAALLARLLEDIRRPPAGGNKYDYVKWALTIDNVAAAWCLPLAQGLGSVDVLILADADATGDEIPSTHTALAGTISAVQAGALVDAAATFVAGGAMPGDIARNVDTGAESVVTEVTSETALALASDIFPTAGHDYALVSLAEQVKAHIDDVRPVTADALRVLAPTPVTQAVTMEVFGDDVDTEAITAEVEAYLAALVPGETLYVSRLIALAMAADGVTDVTITVPAANVAPTAAQMLRPGTVTVTVGV